MLSTFSERLSTKSRHRRRFNIDRLFQIITTQTSFPLQDNESNNGDLVESDLRHLWNRLSQMIHQRLLKHEPCLLPELGAFVLIDHSSADDDALLIKEPFFVLDTTFARRHRLSRIKKPNLSSALSLSLQANGKSTHIEPNTTLSSFNMQTLDYLSLQNQTGLTREQLMAAISQLFAIIDQEVHPYGYCDLEFPRLGHFRISFGLATFEFSGSFLAEFHSTLPKTFSATTDEK